MLNKDHAQKQPSTDSSPTLPLNEQMTEELYGLRNEVKKMKKEIKYLRMFSEAMLDKINISEDNKNECPICGMEIKMFVPGGANIRKNASCPNCHLFERHRAFWLYFKNNTNLFEGATPIKLLHFAPERFFYDKFVAFPNVDYYPVDFNPAHKRISYVVDIQNICFPDEMFDVIICNHVLEHVPNDREAMKELCRVLSKSGVMYLSVPVFENLESTFENFEYNTPELRAKHFGQHDHVRKYGMDFESLLVTAGFDVEPINVCEKLSSDEIKLYGLRPEHILYRCTVNK